MSERLIELARRIQQKPWNEPGTDKTWVLHALWQHRLFSKEIGGAERVAAR
jgi:hypothetical protein